MGSNDWITPQVEEIFNDPRFRHLIRLADLTTDDPGDEDHDRGLALQAIAAAYNLKSAEKHGKAIERATWGLMWATIGLFIATLVLVVVTMSLRGQ